MSVVAEFARIIHEKNSRPQDRILTPLSYPCHAEILHDIKAVIFDIYGTLVNYWHTEFSDAGQKEHHLLDAFRKTADFFKFTAYLEDINPEMEPERTLHDFYHGLIALNHEKSLKKGISFPEVRIEEIWQVILLMLIRHGYDPSQIDLGEKNDLAKCAAYYYNFQALGRLFYEGVVPALTCLRENNIRCGILSNAQFYTPIDLSLFVRDQSNNTLEDYHELFDADLTVFSYVYGVAKPNQILLQKLYDALYELQILPQQTVFVGNDLSLDIQPSIDAGMHTAFFTGDDMSAFVHDLSGTVMPDIVFNSWDELPDKISFFEEKKQ